MLSVDRTSWKTGGPEADNPVVTAYSCCSDGSVGHVF